MLAHFISANPSACRQCLPGPFLRSVQTAAGRHPPHESRLAARLSTHEQTFSLFGAVLYEMTTGRQPFSVSTNAVIFQGILDKQPASIARSNPEVPAARDRIISKALEKDHDVRYLSDAPVTGSN